MLRLLKPSGTLCSRPATGCVGLHAGQVNVVASTTSAVTDHRTSRHDKYVEGSNRWHALL